MEDCEEIVLEKAVASPIISLAHPPTHRCPPGEEGGAAREREAVMCGLGGPAGTCSEACG